MAIFSGCMGATPIGLGENTPFIAFGDESVAGDNDTIVYAYAIVSRGRLHQVEARLRRLKKRFKIPHEITIHCRTFMAPDQRKKLGLDHLSTADIRNLIGHSITLMNDSRVWVKYAYCSLNECRERWAPKISGFDANGEPTNMEINVSHKGLIGLLSNTAMMCKGNHPAEPRPEECQVIVSEERSKTKPLFGPGPRRRSDFYYGGMEFSETHGSQKIMLPLIEEAECHAFFQLADIAAYLCANALSPRTKFPFYTEQLGRILLWTSNRLKIWQVNSDGTSHRPNHFNDEG